MSPYPTLHERIQFLQNRPIDFDEPAPAKLGTPLQDNTVGPQLAARQPQFRRQSYRACWCLTWFVVALRQHENMPINDD
jgi:hypothetical protein